MDPILKKFLTFLREIFSFIIFTMAWALTACFIIAKFYFITVVFVVLNMNIMIAQLIDYAEFSSNAHWSWISFYLLIILFFKSLEDSPLVGLLDNNVTRMVYRPNVEEREQALFIISLSCWIIVTLSYFAYLALDKCLAMAVDQEGKPVDDVEAVEEDEFDGESIGAFEDEQGSRPFKSVVKEMLTDAKKMMIKPIESYGVKKAHENVNVLYKKIIGEPIVEKIKEESKRSKEFEASLKVVNKYLKALDSSYKKTIAEPIYNCFV